jgi:hypothetical protein
VMREREMVRVGREVMVDNGGEREGRQGMAGRHTWRDSRSRGAISMGSLVTSLEEVSTPEITGPEVGWASPGVGV